jgi:hypothetical protein
VHLGILVRAFLSFFYNTGIGKMEFDSVPSRDILQQSNHQGPDPWKGEMSRLASKAGVSNL